MADGGEVFGQRVPPLYLFLKDVLDKYPEGGQILKELVQNADDAKAKKVVFLYDKSEHPCNKLLSDTLCEFQGPALYAYNDANFEEADWHNIQHPQQSGKVEELAKVGRFGLGFISVYHLTDMPCILSDNQIAFLDPLEDHFGRGSPGKRWKMSAKLLDDFRDQFSPYLNELFGCKETNFKNGRFEGTIFRFPLRTRQSKLSKSVFSTDGHRVHELLQSFQVDADISLLFLNHVESITVYERDKLHESPRLIFKVQVHPRDHRISTLLSQISLRQDFETVSCVCVRREFGQVINTSNYITVNALKNMNTSGELHRLIHDDDLKFVPWMGMSLQISSSVEPGKEARGGRVFCFLPLPGSEQTGLPVHVHGYFGLGDNRRSIKWPDQESQHDEKALWNQLLVTEIFPEVYAKLILAVVDKSKDPSNCVQPADVYKGWPSVQNVSMKWRDGIRNLLQLLKNKPVFYTDHNHGTWMKLSDVYINTENSTSIAKVLSSKRCPVARLPDHVVESLDWARVPYQKVTPALVRQRIRNDPLGFLLHEEKLELLEYVTSDTTTDLNNLHLLPLQSGAFTAFSTAAPTVYIATVDNPSALIPNGAAKFAANDLPSVLTASPMKTNTQLKILCTEDVPALLKEMLPNSWRRGIETSIPWTPGINQNPSEEWLKQIWQWLTENPTSLGEFYSVPLIPMKHNHHIARLQENRMIRHKKQQHGVTTAQLTDAVCSLLESVGGVVVHHDLPSFIASHPYLDSFIKAPTPEGVMAVVEAVWQKCNPGVPVQVGKMTAAGKEELRDILSQFWNFTFEQKNILRQLPIFLASDEKYISATSDVAAVPSDYFGIPVKVLKRTRRILIRDEHDSDRLALSLGVSKQTVHDLLDKSFLPAVADGLYSESESLEIMKWVLDRPEFDHLVTESKFVPVCTSAAHDRPLKASPKDLFEPSKTLCVLFRGSNVFPSGAYSQDKLLNCLKRVGLKTESEVSPEDLLKAASEVSATQGTGKADIERGSVLLEYISRNTHLLGVAVTWQWITKPLQKFLEDLLWVPCIASPPPGYPSSAGWKGDSKTLYSPRRVGLIESALLCGSVLPLIKVHKSKQLLSAFNWSEQADSGNYQKVDLVVQHLKNVASHVHSTRETHAVSHTVLVIYEFLSKASDPHLKDLFKRHINASKPWVWHGSGFTTPNKVALSSGTVGVSLVPYLHIVPPEMQRYKSFLAKMGVQETFQESALCTVLLNVQQKHQAKLVSSKEDYEKDLYLVCNILRCIVSLGEFDSDILVPCRSTTGNERYLAMVLASECLYVDEERLAKSLEDLDSPVIHESVSNDVAQRLRLRPLSHVIAPVDTLGYGYDVAGPHETTVNAIKHNLDMYKEGVDIFKELIQNADDAGAEEVKFLLDWRRNEQTTHDLMDEGMKACHGPALWAYNEARFSDKDIENICSIGAQSKKHQLDKVGRFGLGFTSVYHLTDIPSVVSGPYVLICDPRTIHLGSRIKPTEPGIKLDLTKPYHQRTLKSYPNQFQPYNGVFGCNLGKQTSFDHTLFRLPLRTNSEASGQQPNQLSDCVYDSKEKMDPLVESLKRSASTLLLFTQNVVHVSLYELQADDSVCDMKTVMSVTVSRVLQMPRAISCPTADMRNERNLLKATTMHMTDRGTVPETTMIVKITQESCQLGKGKGRPKKENWHFIVSSCMVKGKIFELACSEEGKKAGVLPCGGVAAQLVSSEGGLTPDNSTQGNTFSYLPLDVVTGLPFHVNGSFLLQPNRRQLWSKPSSETGAFETRWNVCFMESVLCKALLNLLQDLRDLQGGKIQSEIAVDTHNFQTLWPRSTCESDFLPFMNAWYRMIGRETNPPPVIFRHGQWVSVHDCFFTSWNQTDPPAVKDSVKAVLTEHQQAMSAEHVGLKRWVELHQEVLTSIKHADANRCFDENTYSVERCLEEVFFPLLRDGEEYIEPRHRDVILRHVLDLRLGERKMTKYDSILKATECIPCDPHDDQALVRPHQLVNPHSILGSLFSEEDCRFPYGDEYCKEDQLLSLTQLGMASNDLSWEDVCERAESISRARNSLQRSVKLLKLIDEKLKLIDEKLKLKDEKLRGNHNPPSDQRKRIQEAEFLPVLKRPKGFPSEWYHSDNDLMSADSLYESCHKDLLGSVQPLLDEERLGSEAMSDRVKNFLGLKEKRVAVSDVIRQLNILVNGAHKVTQSILPVVQSIYSFLQGEICDCHGNEVVAREEHCAAIGQLRTLKFVWYEGKFRDCKQFAFHYDGKNGPHLYRVPSTLMQFSNLLKICGVKEKFAIGDFCETLQLLKRTYLDKPVSESDLKTAKAMLSEIVSRKAADAKDNKQSNLQDNMLQAKQHAKLHVTCVQPHTAKTMLSEIVSTEVADAKDNKQSNMQDYEIFVPDTKCILRTPSELTFSDMPWEDNHDEDTAYTHPVITQHESKVFGITTQREKQLKRCSSFRGFEREFGQREELTDRLNGILRSYSNVSDVFKELLQNADDAGCTEIHFVYDPRSHPAKKIVSDSWAAVQQLPALCVYNDKPFTEADILGIQRVGVGGKRDDIATTGKFGIGFNVIYHLTDCPSFLSNSDTLCVFDPLLKFVPGAQKTSPGIMIDTGREFREEFPDMMRGYLEDVDGLSGKKGTVFRFPLRKMASELSKEVFPQHRVETLLKEFEQTSKEGLLFLNNIKTVTISCIDKRTNKLETKYQISAKLSDEDEQGRVALSQHLKLFKDNLCETSMSHVYSLTTHDSRDIEQTWLISQVLGFEDPIDAKDVSSAACLKKPLPRGGVAALIEDERLRIPLHQQYRSKAYCFLPLQIHTALPVHVNGTFELDSARRNLAKGEAFARPEDSAEEDGLIHKWNRLLVENVIAAAYAKLISHAGRKILDTSDESVMPFNDLLKLYNQLFPDDLKTVHEEWLLLAKATLHYISQKNLQVLPVVCPGENGRTITWHNPNSLAFFDDLYLQDNLKTGAKSLAEKAEETGKGATPKSKSSLLRSCLLKVGFNLLASSAKLCEAFQASDVDAKFVTPQAVVKHLSLASEVQSHLPVILKDTPFKDMQTFHALFKYCLNGVTHPVELNGLPLLLTNDGILREFTTTYGLYVTSYCDLLSNVKEKFLHKELVKSCTSWLKNNKVLDEAYASGVFRQFTLSELAQHLGKQLPEEWQGCDHHVDWTPDRNGHPSKSWLGDLWAFLCSETSDENPQLSLEVINNWPIIPTKSGRLVPPALSKTVMFPEPFCDSEPRRKLICALRALGLPEVALESMGQRKTHSTSTQLLPSGLEPLLKDHLALPIKHGDVTNAVQFILRSGCVGCSLSLPEKNTLLQFFQEEDSLSHESIQTIKQLPLFLLQGKQGTTDLQPSQHYHTTEYYQIPQAEAETWMNNMGCVFLHHQLQFTHIYNQLGITPLTQADIYLRYILPSFHLLSQEAQLTHIKFLSELTRTLNEDKETFLRQLSCIPFIPDHTGTLRSADYFFDPHKEVFKAMVDANKLLPESMGRYKSGFVWSLLKQIGLHTEVKKHDFLKFAKEVELRACKVHDGNEQKKLFAISRLLTEELDNNTELHDPSFLHTISSVRFIPAVSIKKELLDIHPAYSAVDDQQQNQQKSPFVSYGGSVPERHCELVWSVSPLLPYWAVPHDRPLDKNVTIHSCLRIHTKVVTDKVLSHTQNVCEHMKQKNAFHREDEVSGEVRATVKNVMKRILKYLQDNMEQQGNEIKRRLQCTPICPAEEGCVFVRANQIVFNMEDDRLRPYLYRVPKEFMTYYEVLKLLGAQESFSFDQLAGVLSTLKIECGDQRLGPNEKKIATYVVSTIFTLLIKNQSTGCKMSVTELYLPSSEYFLRKASDLYYTDPSLMEQVKMASTNRECILPLKHCEIEVKDEMRLIELLPERLRPKNLGTEMMEKPCDTNEDCPAGEYCEYLEHVKRMLQSEEMARVLLRLVQDQQKTQKPVQETIDLIKEFQGFIKLFCKTELKLGLYDNQGAVIANYQYSRAAFCDKSSGSIYLEHSGWPSQHMSLTFAQIAKCCNDLLGNLFDSDHVSYLQSALDSPTPNEMNMVLTKCKIPEFDTTTQAVQPDEHRPGTIIPRDIQHLLDHNPFNRFHKGEIVGYERSIEDRRGDEFHHPVSESAALGTGEWLSSEPATNDEVTEKVYAVIVDRIDEDEESQSLSQQYCIDVGQEEYITVSVTMLYKFLRPKPQPDMTVVPFTGDPAADAPMASSGKTCEEDLQKDREQIKREVEEVFRLPKEEQRRAIHRLYLRWHPDKNLEHQQRATEAFKYLKQEINRHDTLNQYSQRYAEWESQVRREREEARQYQERYYKSESSKGRASTNFVPPSFSRDTPDPRSARLWFRQAKEHFNTAKQTSKLEPAPTEWIAFQVHQAAETALKAAQYSLNGLPDLNSNDLVSLARTICQHRDVPTNEVLMKACELERLDCHFTKPRYPKNSQTSGEVYHGLSAKYILKACEELLILVQDIIGIKVF